MIRIDDLIEKIDDARASSVSDEEFERTWNKSLDEKVQELMSLWDELLALAKRSVKDA